MIIVGMMSGTSTDGIDAVVVRFGEAPSNGVPPQFEILKHVSFSFEPAQRAEILASLRADTGTVDRICALNFDLGETYANAALGTIQAAGLTPADVALIGNHGQTVWHIPNHSTLQVGSPAVIAERTGITTISNFRSRDIAAGGHGAPMVSFVDQLLFTHPTLNRGLQNIGGIANVTYLPALSGHPERSTVEGTTLSGARSVSTVEGTTPDKLGSAFAFDSGPGNVLIDDAVRRATNGAQEYDDGGKIAARGTVNDALLNELMAHPYLRAQPPKTTGREIFGTPFGGEVWAQAMARGISSDDLITTLTMFTAQSIADGYKDFLPTLPAEIIVSGGGAKNPTLLHMLQSQVGPAAQVRRIDEFGIPADAKEALAFAILAYQTWHGRPSNLPAATGARHPVIQGDITPGQNAQFSMHNVQDSRNP